MFNATELRVRAGKKTRLDSYLKRDGFSAILQGLMADKVPEEEIMITARGPNGSTMLHDAFFMDFMCWVGGMAYYKATKRFVTYKG
jgi:hypothetical protein